MKRFFVWLALMSKRLLKKPSFVIILAMLPLVLMMYRFVITEEDGTLRAALYISDKEDTLSEHLAEELVNSDGIVTFYTCSTEQELYDDVVAGRAECGYIFSEDLLERFLDKEWRGTITTVVAGNSQFSAFVNEWVYAVLYKNLECDLVMDYLTTKSGINMDEDEARILVKEAFDAAMEKAVVFEFKYVSFDTREEITEFNSEAENHMMKPIRGTVALFVFLAGLAGLVFWYQDDAEGRFRVMAYNKRPAISFGSLLLPVMLAGCVGIVCLLVSGVAVGIFKELWCMLWYTVLVAAFCNLLRHLIPSVNAVCAMIPILAVATYLCCPIILDLKALFPMVDYVRKLLMADYYLQCFLGRSLWVLPAVALGVFGVSALFREKY